MIGKISSSAAFDRHIESGKLKRCYCVFSPEELMRIEARAQLRAAFSAQTRNVQLLDASFSAKDAIAECSTASLFGGTRLFEFVSSNPLSATHGEALIELAAAAASDAYVIVVAAPPRKAKWITKLERDFVRVDLPAVVRSNHLSWLKSRAAARKLKLTQQQIGLCADFTEGDLVAAVSLIEQLSLVTDDGTVTTDQLRAALFDSTSDDIYSLREVMAAGDRTRLRRALRNLRTTGTPPALVSWGIAEEIRTLLILLENGRAWVPSRTHLHDLQDAAKRVPRDSVLTLLAAAAQADWCAKGLMPGQNPWTKFESLAMAFGTLIATNNLPRELLA